MDEVKPYIDFATSASARSRQTLYVLIVASTLIGSSVWNYRPESWDNRELEVLGYAARYLGEPKAQPELDELHIRAIEYCKLGGISWNKNEQYRKVLIEKLNRHREKFIEKYGQVKVPIIGVAFNPNDVGLIGGFVLSVILMSLHFALVREKANLQQALLVAKLKHCLIETYDLISMSQVLTVPPGSPVPHQKWWNLLHKPLYWLPLLVHSVVVFTDIRTLQQGWVISPSGAIVELIGGGLNWGLILVFTWACHRESNLTDQCWKDVEADVLMAKQAKLITGGN